MHNKIADYLNKNVSGCNAVVNLPVAVVGDSSITIENSYKENGTNKTIASKIFESNTQDFLIAANTLIKNGH